MQFAVFCDPSRKVAVDLGKGQTQSGFAGGLPPNVNSPQLPSAVEGWSQKMEQTPISRGLDSWQEREQMTAHSFCKDTDSEELGGLGGDRH